MRPQIHSILFAALFFIFAANSAHADDKVVDFGGIRPPANAPYPAIWAYTAGAYPIVHKEESARADAIRRQLAAELSQLPAAPGDVWHGGCVSTEELAQMELGKIKSFRFLSTTKIPGIAANYANVRFGQSGGTCLPIILKINQFTGRDIKPYSVFPEEQEILLGPADFFEVTARPPAASLPTDVREFLEQQKRLQKFSYIEFIQSARADAASEPISEAR